jgi:hypothetical protein
MSPPCPPVQWMSAFSLEYSGLGHAVHLYKVLLHLASGDLRFSRVLWFQVIYQQPNPGIKYEYMLPMKLGDLTPAMMSVPSVSRTVADNAVIAPPLHLPPGTRLPRTRPRKGNISDLGLGSASPGAGETCDECVCVCVGGGGRLAERTGLTGAGRMIGYCEKACTVWQHLLQKPVWGPSGRTSLEQISFVILVARTTTVIREGVFWNSFGRRRAQSLPVSLHVAHLSI